MTKSKNGCLKILCGGAGSDATAGSDPETDAHADESKAISDKSRWSFRRRSTRHRVLKNSDISEPETLSSSKAKADVAPSNNVYSSTYSYASEKPLHLEKPDEKIVLQEKPDEKSLLEEKPDEKQTEKTTEKPVDQIIERSIEQPDEKITETPSEEPAERISEKPVEEPAEKDVEELDEKPDESFSVSPTEVKQDETASLVDRSVPDPEEDHVESAAIVIQSGIRTYNARQELSNHKDLVKLQAVIRGHLVRRQAAESLQCLLAIVKTQGLVRTHQAQQSSGRFQDTLVRSSSEKLLHNGFALKLMDNMSTSKSMNIRCDASETDATWKWMERWTTLILPTTEGHLLENAENSGLVVEKMEEDAHHEEKVVPLDSDISFPKLVPDDVEETLRPSESSAFVEETPRSFDLSGLEAPECVPEETSMLETKGDPAPELIEKVDDDAEQLTDSKTENVVEQSLDFSGRQSTQTGPSREPSPVPEKSEHPSEDTMDAYNLEQSPEMEARSAARKACNPAFAAAQMKFEELTSAVSRSNSSSFLDAPSKSKVHTPRSLGGTSPKQNIETVAPGSTVGHDAKIIPAASECGTEISISSTLDSPDRSEADGGEIVMEMGALGGRDYASENAEKDTHVLHSEVKDTSEEVVQPEKEEELNGDVANPPIATDPVLEQAHVESGKPDLHDQIEESIGSYAKSPEGTPMSRTTFVESQCTPSSEVSVNTNKSKSKSKKSKSHASRRSLTSPSSNSVGRSSTDNLSKDYKHAKRESSGKVAKSDNADQEPRMSNSTPLPSYMQFTESARAKAAALSPKLSPDVQDNNPRKRHSLPITNGKNETSPRMQRSSSQAQQNVKSSVAVPHTPSDKRWNI
ncbi:protein IQ-DOMAIN 32 [Triticum aestivum]|uniref:protein IQ-DOMAIN 32 n=1 Tax=Triticum aestivum TaxID=4565 RepID=UPI001D02E24D|nr:protein IQ-DOMAIN 32-like [Triticum aestivum]